jgi:RHS repeat-associated protein
MTTEYIASIDNALLGFKNKTLITQEYRQIVKEWATASSISGRLGGPTLEMEKTLRLNDSKTVVSENDRSFESSVVTCPKSGEIKVALAYESTLELPIPDVTIEIYEDVSFGFDSKVATQQTDEQGIARFPGLTAGKKYYVKATDPQLEQHNDQMLQAYDGLMLEMYDTLSTQWQTYRPQWQLSPINAGLLTALGAGLYDGMFGLWDDVKLAYDVITDPAKYGQKIYAEAGKYKDLITQLDEQKLKSLLEGSKQMARELLALFNDEAALYLFMRSVELQVRMYPWGALLEPMVKIGGSIISDALVGIVFGALLTLVTAGLGVAFLIYKVGSLLKKLGSALQSVWQGLKTILFATLELVKRFFEKTRQMNLKRQANAKLKQDRKNQLGSSNQTGLVDNSGTVKNSPATNAADQPTVNSQCTPGTGCPVSLINGEELLTLDDGQLIGLTPFIFQRQYRTTAVERTSVFGFGWSHSLQHQVEFIGDELHWTDHQTLTTILPLPTEVSPSGLNYVAGAAAYLDEEPNSYCLMAGSMEGWVLHVHRVTGQTTGRITGLSHRQLRLTLHYHDGLPVRLEHPAGAALQFSYQELPQGWRLTQLSLTPESGREEALHPLMTYEYDERGQLSAAINAAGEAERYQYRDDYVFSLRQLAGGAEFYWEWQGEGKQARAVHHWSNLPNFDQRFLWDEQPGAVTLVHQDGSRETWQHDTRFRRLIKKVDPDGATHLNEYGERGELLSETDPLGNRTEYGYNGELQCTWVRTPDGQETQYRYSRGRVVEKTTWSLDQEDKIRERYRYDTQGNLTEETDALGNTCHYLWSAQGALNEVQYPDGSRERFVRDAFGQVLEHHQRNGLTHYYRYNLLGQVIRHSDSPLDEAGVNGTRYTWNAANRLEAIHAPDGTVRHYRYNAYGKVTSERDEKGLTTQYEYHPNSHLVSRVIYPDLSQVEYRYDNPKNFVSDIINQNGEHHRLAYYPNGLVSEEHTVDGRHFLYDYDLNGHLTQRTEYGTSQSEQTALVTRYERDAAGRLVRKVLPDGKEVCYAYDSFNRLRLVDDGHWPLAYGYDEVGRLTEEYQGFASLFYGYDNAGNLTRQRLPDGNLLAYHYQQGQVSRIDLNGRILSEHQYRGERETRRITGEVVSEFDYDAQQRLRHQRATAVVQAELEGDAPDVTPVMQRRYEYDPAGNLTQILDPHKGNREYRYDKQHRLTEALHHPIAYPEALPQALRWRGISEQFTHDAAGNVLGNDAASRGTQVRGNLLKQKGDVRFEYDEFGNLTREVRSTKPLWVREFRYDCQHRLVEFIEQRQGQKTHFAYTYDAFGRRIQKQDLLAQRPDALTRFFWQGERMVAECADDDNIFTADDPKPAHLATYKSYLYSPGSFVPLVQLLGKGRKSEIYYYLNDHLGTPQELVNGKGQIAWSAAYRAYGNLAVAFVESVPQPLRFQGQYFDAESGLHYNRHRYYSPETARFITPDPIGLAGGLNQTQYVPNPTGWVDPLGLTSVPGGCPPGVRNNAASQNQSGQWVDAHGNLSLVPNVSGLPPLKGKSVGHIQNILIDGGYTRTNPANPKNQRWVHPDGSEVQIHAYGNTNTTPYKAGNNAHVHKSLGRHGNPGTVELADNGSTSVSTHSSEAHIGIKNPSDFPAVSGRSHGQ